MRLIHKHTNCIGKVGVVSGRASIVHAWGGRAAPVFNKEVVRRVAGIPYTKGFFSE